MKKVVFSDKKSFVITQSEFQEAYLDWKQKREYFCKRLDALISQFYMYVCPLYDNMDWENRVLPEDESMTLAYNREKKEFWYVIGWPYDKLLKSITGEDSFSGCIPKKMEIIEPVDGKIKEILAKTMLIDDFIDMKYKK